MKNFLDELKGLWNESDKKAVLGIGFITVILAIYCYFGIQDFFAKLFPDANNLDYWKYIYHHFSALVLFLGVGLIFVKFVLKSNFKEYGLGTGDHKLGLKICLIATPILILAGLSTVVDADMNSAYPLSSFVINAPFQYVLLYYVSYLAYYIGWEFLFRGIGIFSMKGRGVVLAIAVTTMISALIHTSIAGFGKPFAETFSAIPAGVAFGYVAYKTKSVWYCVYLHMVVGFSTDFFISLFTRSGLI